MPSRSRRVAPMTVRRAPRHSPQRQNESKAAALATDTRKRLLAVPDRVAGRFGLPREVIEGIAEEIRDALVELSTMGSAQ